MVFLFSLGVSILFVIWFSKVLRAHPIPFYVGAAAIALAVVTVTWHGVALPSGFKAYIWPMFARGGLAGAMFVIVMFTGAFPNGSAPIKKLMPIRGPLSILASILTLGHNAAYGRLYFVRLFTHPASLPTGQLLAAVCSVLMMLIMLPLFITSFMAVRRKMQPKRWKALQRLAYGFYGLFCCHILLLTVPEAVHGERAYQLTVFVYGTVFLSYLFCRISKVWAKKKNTSCFLAKRQAGAVICCTALSACVTLFLGMSNSNSVESAPPVESFTESQSGYRDGTYTGSAMGMNAPIEVSVTVEGGHITDISIVSSRDDEPYFSDALYVIDDILAANHTQVDTVTGATYSSGGILDAAEAALESAGG